MQNLKCGCCRDSEAPTSIGHIVEPVCGGNVIDPTAFQCDAATCNGGLAGGAM